MRKLLIGFLVILTMLFAVVPAASAFDLREGTSRQTVAKDEVIDDDLLMFGTAIKIEGTVNGDVFAFGDSVFVTGTINGNLVTAASHIEINGPVSGTVYTAGSDIFVNSRVGRSVVAAGSTVVLDQNSSIGHSLLAAGDRVYTHGVIGRGAGVAGNIVKMQGKVGKEVRAYADTLRIESGAVIEGPVEYSSSKEAFIAGDAKTGPVTYTFADMEWDGATFWSAKWWKAISFIGFVAFGLVILALFPSLRRTFPQLVLEKPWQLPVTGLVALIAIPIMLVILLLTVIGIPFSLLGMLAFPVLIYVGQVLVAYAVGRLLGDHVAFMQNWAWPALFLVGAVLTTAVVNVPTLGWLFSFGFLLYGLGGILWQINNRRRVA